MSQNRIGPELAPHTTFIMVIYILYLIGFSVIGVIMAYVKLGDVDGTLYGDHLRYLIKTFWIAFIGGIISVVRLSSALSS